MITTKTLKKPAVGRGAKGGRPTLPSQVAKFQNAVNERFDVVSCQFAIHYMFRSDDTLDTFCKNVDRVLKVGGHFIGTCLNGAYVNARFGSRDRVEGKHNDNVMWMLQKKYDDYAEKRTGQKIGVYLESINQVYDEYLVDFELLKEKLEAYKIRVLSPEDMKKLGITSSIGDFKVWYEADKYALSETLMDYSFLNSWFVFKK